MARTVDQIREQIARLPEQEKALLQKEVDGVIGRIRAAVAHYGITAEQIFGVAGEVKPVGRKAAGGRKNALKAAKPKKSASKRQPAPAAEGTNVCDQ